METIIKKITHTEEDKKIYEQAGQILRAGGLVAFPTETVYGLGADALDAKADVMLDTTFESVDALKAYAVNPKHVAVADGKVRPYTAIRSCLDYEV